MDPLFSETAVQAFIGSHEGSTLHLVFRTGPVAFPVVRAVPHDSFDVWRAHLERTRGSASQEFVRVPILEPERYTFWQSNLWPGAQGCVAVADEYEDVEGEQVVYDVSRHWEAVLRLVAIHEHCNEAQIEFRAHIHDADVSELRGVLKEFLETVEERRAILPIAAAETKL